MSKRIRSFDTRQEALNFRDKNKLPIKEIKKITKKDGSGFFYTIIVSDAVYKRWAHKQKREDPQNRNHGN